MAPITETDIGLKVLHDPVREWRCRAEEAIDIVAVHGMGAHPSHTWSKKMPVSNAGNVVNGETRYVNWLEDKTMLPKLVPGARIMRYGYWSHGWGPDGLRTRGSDISQKLIEALREERKQEDCQYRPLIFIAHSYGGLVVLQMLLDAKMERRKYLGIYHLTTGLVFFGTPFRGTHDDFSGDLLLERAEKLHNRVYRQNYEMFRAGNDSLLNVVDSFLRTTADDCRPQTVCFYERKETNMGIILKKEVGQTRKVREAKGEKSKVNEVNGDGKEISKGEDDKDEEIWGVLVGEHSGCLDSDRSTVKCSRACDHFDINKFGSPDEDDFKRLGREIAKMLEQKDGIIARRNEISRDLVLGADHTTRHEILLWLSEQANPSGKNLQIARHHTLNQRYLAGTCDWVLRLDQVRKWRSIQLAGAAPMSTPPLLWLHGKPGAGKSVIAAQMVKKMRETTPTIFVYCEYAHRKSQTRESLLCGAIHQMIECLDRNQSLPKEVVDAWEKYKSDTGGLPAEECPALLIALVQRLKECFIVLDGLDEYAGEENETPASKYPIDVFQDLHHVAIECRDHCRMLVASRDDVYNYYKGQEIEAYDITIEAQEKDIVRYVEARLQSPTFPHRRELQLPKHADLLEDIVEMLKTRAKGLFLLHQLHLQLENCDSLHAIRKGLSQIPAGLFELYNRALARIKGDMNDRGQAGLSYIEIVLCAARRLSVDEFQHAVAIEKGDSDFNDEGFVKEHTILARTAGLLVIEDDSTFQFMHYTVEEYLRQPDVYDENFGRGDLRLAEKCLAYLSLTDLGKGRKEIKQLQQEYPFLHYAAHNLCYHVSKCIHTGLMTVVRAIVLLENDKSLPSLQVVGAKVLNDDEEEYIYPFLPRSSTLNRAIMWGMDPVVKDLVYKGANINPLDFTNPTPLHLAASALARTSTKILLESQADISAVNIGGKTALDMIVVPTWHKAYIRAMDENLLCFLLDEGQNSTDDVVIPLQHAAVSKMDLLRDAIVSFDDIDQGLHNLIKRNEKLYTLISTLIIHNFKKLDITDDGEYLAIELIKAGVDVNSRHYPETTPLQLAAFYGRVELVRALLEHDANPFVQGPMGHSALEIANIRAKQEPARPVFQVIAGLIAAKEEEALRLEALKDDEQAKKDVSGPAQAKDIEAFKAGAVERSGRWSF